ncbi:MAG TPA: endo-1,3-alpha-glucanase family glycosylhydrolase [Chloroflexota bacterium]
MRIRPLLSSFLATACVVVAGLSPATSAPNALAYNEDRPVLAYYYAWWDPSNFGQTLFQPGQAYNSDDPGIIQRHVQEAQSAGIDGFVMSWYGSGDRTDANLATLLGTAKQTGFRATIHFETPHFWGVDDVVAQLKAFYAARIGHPAIVRYQGRPVIFFWRASIFDNATWNAIRAQVDPDHVAVWIADGDQFGILSGDAWDGISPYAIAWSASPSGQLPNWAAKAAAAAPGKLWIPPVSPGCNDSAVRAATCVRDRGDGAYYQATWDGALASNPQWAIIVSTFNEWMESTQIEPSVQYGDQYLRITRQNADQYRASTQPGNG